MTIIGRSPPDGARLVVSRARAPQFGEDVLPLELAGQPAERGFLAGTGGRVVMYVVLRVAAHGGNASCVVLF
jgi:hypothetical protein